MMSWFIHSIFLAKLADCAKLCRLVRQSLSGGGKHRQLKKCLCSICHVAILDSVERGSSSFTPNYTCNSDSADETPRLSLSLSQLRLQVFASFETSSFMFRILPLQLFSSDWLTVCFSSCDSSIQHSTTRLCDHSLLRLHVSYEMCVSALLLLRCYGVSPQWLPVFFLCLFQLISGKLKLERDDCCCVLCWPSTNLTPTTV